MEQISDEIAAFKVEGEYVYCATLGCPHCHLWEREGSFTLGELVGLAAEHMKDCAGSGT